MEDPARGHCPLGARPSGRVTAACKCPLKAEIRTFIITCMREAIFCVPCISFKAADAAGGLEEALSPPPVGLRQALSFLTQDRSTRSIWSPWALPTPMFWVSSNLRGEGPGVLPRVLEKLSGSIQDQCLGKDRTQCLPHSGKDPALPQAGAPSCPILFSLSGSGPQQKRRSLTFRGSHHVR